MRLVADGRSLPRIRLPIDRLSRCSANLARLVYYCLDMANDGQNESAGTKTGVSDAAKHQLELEKLEFERQKYQLDILKTLHEAGFQRWKDRRDNEWKLNYAVWGAIAGLDALLIANRYTFRSWLRYSIAASVLALVFHAAYLLPTIMRAINEIQLQSDTEKAMRALIKDEGTSNLVSVDHLGGAIDKFDDKAWWWLWKGYGLVAPLALTAALLGLAVFLLKYR